MRIFKIKTLVLILTITNPSINYAEDSGMEWFKTQILQIQDEGGLENQSFTIANAEALRNKDPRTFSIPRLEQRRNLKVGDNAKVLLEPKQEGGRFAGERPWVIIEEVLSNGQYKAKFDNDLTLFPEHNDDIITISAENILSVILPDEYNLPYSKTCKVSPSVQDGSAWTLSATRINPEKDKDSGWRIFASNESIESAVEETPCGSAMTSYPVLDSILDEPNFKSWVWNEQNNEFNIKK